MIAAVHAAHLAGLAVRALDVSHVIVTGKDTIRLSAAGLLDLIMPSTARNMPMLQAEDLVSIARVLINLACTSPNAASQQSLQNSMGYIQATFSPELSQLLMLLLSPQCTIYDVVAMTSGRMMTRMSQTQAYADALTSELSKECENGRLLRLLVKLTHVADRPTLYMDEQWGEHSDRHLLRLFRDAVFHQTDEQGGAVIDFAQTINSLNKLDAGQEVRTS
jgi:PAB-dependent poly(A)-specific ribonuclease subunit 3